MSHESLQQLEQSVIGAVILDASVLNLLPTLESLDFQSGHAKYAWDAIRNLEATNSPIDVTTVSDELAKMGRTGTEWVAYLGECALKVPTAANAVEYARRVRDASLRNRILRGLGDIAEQARRNPDMTGADLLSLGLEALSRMDAEQPDSASSIGAIVQRRLKQLEKLEEERRNGGPSMTGFPTGIEILDQRIGGWQPGIVSIIAARPAMGKSSLGLATADACSAAGVGVHVFSLEDAEAPYADRSMSRMSRVAADKIRRLMLDRGEFQNLQDAMRKLGRRQHWLFDDRSGITADEVVRSVRRHKRENKTRLVIVDYIQLLKKSNPRMSTHEALGESITALADAAKQDGIAYVVMSQLNRSLESRDDKRPMQSDLRESGSLEERSKCIVGVYRGSVYGDPKRHIDYECNCPRGVKADGHFCTPPSDEEFAAQVQLIILKNSNGDTGKVTATWHGPTTRME